MKNRMLLLAPVILLAVVPLVGRAQGKYVPTADEVYYGTWTNENMQHQKAVDFAGGYKDYTLISDANPVEEGTEQIAESWTDSEGSIWYKTFGTITSGSYKGVKWQTLSKVTRSGTVFARALTWVLVAEFDPNLYPPKIDPTDSQHYKLYYRAEK